MNWISNVVRPRISSFLTTKREVPDNMWVKCPETGQMVFCKDLEANQFVIPGSDYHMRMGAQDRLEHTFDDGNYKAIALPSVVTDPLKFRDGRRYTDRLKDARTKTELEDAVLVGEGTLEGQHVIAAVQDFRFLGGSLGMAAGEAIITGMLRAVEIKSPFILFAASGGARMQEGILSLMQMPRTTIGVQRLREHNLPYIVVLTDPTTGGVTASYAMLGDIHIAEPGALICFAGPRVIQQTIREQLPDGFQRAEYLLEHGMVDMVVHRHKMRETLARVIRLLRNQPELEAANHIDAPLLLTETSPDEASAPADIGGEPTATVGSDMDGGTPPASDISDKAPADAPASNIEAGKSTPTQQSASKANLKRTNGAATTATRKSEKSKKNGAGSAAKTTNKKPSE